MSQVTTAEFVSTDRAGLRVADVLGRIVFVSLLVLIVFTAIPYGTAEAWWKAFFVCAVFTLAIFWLIEGLLSGAWIEDGWSLILPIATLALFAFLQTLPFANQSGNSGAIHIEPWNAVSSDPYQTRFFVLQLLGLMLAGLLLFRYVSTERRLRILINVVIAVAVASAIFGILRQTTQHSVGFGLPRIAPDQGYGQFINKNHFAFLMEMAFGLTLGIILGGGVKREQGLIYLAALLPLWTALVLCGSRGGIIAMLAQVITAALLFSVVQNRHATEPRSKFVTIARSLPVKVTLVVVLVFGVVFGTLWLGGDRLATSIEQSRTEFNSDNTESRLGASRKEIWELSWRMFTAHPILGVGMGGYWAAVPAAHNASGTMTPQEAHNDYLELLASGGLVGLAIGVWFAVVMVNRTRQNLRSANRFRRAACFGALIGITGVAVHSLVDFGLHMIANALVFTTLIVIATSKATWARGAANNYD